MVFLKNRRDAARRRATLFRLTEDWATFGHFRNFSSLWEATGGAFGSHFGSSSTLWEAPVGLLGYNGVLEATSAYYHRIQSCG